MYHLREDMSRLLILVLLSITSTSLTSTFEDHFKYYLFYIIHQNIFVFVLIRNFIFCFKKQRSLYDRFNIVLF